VKEVRHCVTAAAPAPAVWAVLEDVGRLPELSPGTVEVVAPDRLTEVGQTFEQTVELGGKRFTSTWTVEAITAGECLVISGRLLPGTQYEMTEELRPLGDDRTEVCLTMRYKLPFGPLGRLAARLGAERRATEEGSQVLEAVARAAEGAGQR
jgi:uncharacterized membrane protein